MIPYERCQDYEWMGKYQPLTDRENSSNGHHNDIQKHTHFKEMYMQTHPNNSEPKTLALPT